MILCLKEGTIPVLGKITKKCNGKKWIAQNLVQTVLSKSFHYNESRITESTRDTDLDQSTNRFQGPHQPYLLLHRVQKKLAGMDSKDETLKSLTAYVKSKLNSNSNQNIVVLISLRNTTSEGIQSKIFWNNPYTLTFLKGKNAKVSCPVDFLSLSAKIRSLNSI